MSASALSASALRVVMKQMLELTQRPMEGIVVRESDDLSVIEADIAGPEDTPFYGGVFTVALHLSAEYPEQPPKGFFRTRIFHPNVSEKGDICVNTLKKDWDPSLGLRHVFTVVRCLLIEPNPESALNEEAGRLLLEEYSEYVKKAKMMTAVHAVRRAVAALQSPLVVDDVSTDGAAPLGVGALQMRTATASNTSPAVGANSTIAGAPVTNKTAATNADKRKAALKRL